ncbi:hypothetical protein ACDX66_09935 [Peribacillus frigoritolerans]
MTNIKEFNELHFAKDLLILGNAWDLLSALLPSIKEYREKHEG